MMVMILATLERLLSTVNIPTRNKTYFYVSPLRYSQVKQCSDNYRISFKRLTCCIHYICAQFDSKVAYNLYNNFPFNQVHTFFFVLIYVKRLYLPTQGERLCPFIFRVFVLADIDLCE